MKKLLVLILSLIMSLSAFSLFGCGEEETPQGGGETPPAEEVIEGTSGLKYGTAGQGDGEYAYFNGVSSDCTEKDIVIASHYKGLKVVEIGIGAYAVSNVKKIESVKVHKYVKRINSSAFSGATNLVKIDFDEECELERIDSSAFKNCAKLESFNYSGKINVFGDYVFDNCPALKTTEHQGAVYTGSTTNPYLILLKGDENAESCIVPKDCQVIYANAFDKYKNLKNFTFEAGNTLASIGSYAFRESSITEISIPGTVVNIGTEAFKDCDNMKLVVFSEDSQCKFIGPYAFMQCDVLEEVRNFGKIQVEKLEERLLNKCPKITYIDIPKTAKLIGPHFMMSCTSLKVVNIPKDSQLEEIQEQVFRQCRISKIYIPKTVHTIRWDPFAWNTPRTQMFCETLQAQPNWMHRRWNSYDTNKVSISPEPPAEEYLNPTYFYSDTPKAGCWHWVGDEPTLW